MQITNTSSTPFTISTLKEYLKTNGYVSLSKTYPATGQFNYPVDGDYTIVGVYCARDDSSGSSDDDIIHIAPLNIPADLTNINDSVTLIV